MLMDLLHPDGLSICICNSLHSLMLQTSRDIHIIIPTRGSLQRERAFVSPKESQSFLNNKQTY